MSFPRLGNVVPVAMTLAGTLLASVALTAAAHAQNVDSAMLLHPPADSWPSYHGDYSGRRHSTLTQITPAQRRQPHSRLGLPDRPTATIKSSPILVDGVLYFTVPDNVWADRCAHRPSALALHLPAQQGCPHRPARRRHLQGPRLLHLARRPSDLLSTPRPARFAGMS